MKASFKSIVTTFKKMFTRTPKVITPAVVYEQKEEKKERMATGRSNGLLSVADKNKNTCKENKVTRRRIKNKMGRTSRKINQRQAA